MDDPANERQGKLSKILHDWLKQQLKVDLTMRRERCKCEPKVEFSVSFKAFILLCWLRQVRLSFLILLVESKFQNLETN